MKKVVIFGDGSVALDAYYDLEHDSPLEVAGFTKDGNYIDQSTLFDLPIVPFEEVTTIFPASDHYMLVALGYANMNRLRADRYQQALKKGYESINSISSTAYTWSRFETGVGNNFQVAPNTVIHPTAQIGDNVVIGPGTYVSSNCVIKDHTFIGAGSVLAENVTVESYCYLGANSNIRNGVTIAEECVIGAGAIILDDTVAKEVYMGEPAEKLPITSDKLRLS